jgi:MscS family membrane protein
MVFGLENYITNDYFRALIIVVVLLFVLRIFASILQRAFLRLVSKTKTELDDIILEKSSKPITLILLLISLWIGIGELSLVESVNTYAILALQTVIVIVIGYLAYVISDIVLMAAWRKFAQKTNTNIEEALVSMIHTFLKVIIIVLAGLYILDLWGVEIGPFLAGLGIAGLAVALALQETLSNIFGGISMILDKSVRVGDLVTLDDGTSGTVLKIGLRSTKIRTFDNELIILPNSKLASSKVQNVALPEPKTRVVVPFNVAYGSDVDKVKKVVLFEIKKIKGLINDPEPSVKFLEMANSSLNFKAYFYLDSYKERLGALDEANTRIYNALNKAGIEIPFPQMDVHLKK